MRFRGFIFDLDGVLVDSSKIHYAGWKNVLGNFDRDMDYETFRSKYFGKRGQETLNMIFGDQKFSAEEAKEISDEVDSNFVKTVADIGVPIGGALDFVRSLKKSGEKVALATSAPRQNVEAFLDAFSFRGAFDAEVCGDDVLNGKPDPEVFLMAAARLTVLPRNCVVFEDSLPGVTAAKASGAFCIALLTTTSRDVLKAADFFITDFHDAELRNIIRSKSEAKV